MRPTKTPLQHGSPRQSRRRRRQRQLQPMNSHRCFRHRLLQDGTLTRNSRNCHDRCRGLPVMSTISASDWQRTSQGPIQHRCCVNACTKEPSSEYRISPHCPRRRHHHPRRHRRYHRPPQGTVDRSTTTTAGAMPMMLGMTSGRTTAGRTTRRAVAV